jgi:hypothetical protein
MRTAIGTSSRLGVCLVAKIGETEQGFSPSRPTPLK